jgi:hypothetical protein
MRTLEFLSTFLLAVVHLNVCVAAVAIHQQAEQEESHHSSVAKLRHRRHILRIDPNVLRSTLLGEQQQQDQAATRHAHRDSDNAYSDLADEWVRLMKRGKDQSLSFSMPIATPNRPVARPPKGTTPSAPRPTAPKGTTPTASAPTVLMPVEPLPPPVDASETPVAPLPPPVSPPIEVPEGSAIPTTMEPSPTAVPPNQETPFPSNEGGGGGGPDSECESLDRADAMLAAVETVSSNVDLDPATPTGFAVDWLVNDDPAMLNPCTDNVTQRFSLATLYSATVGTSWTNSSGWLSAAPICVRLLPIASDSMRV